MKIGILGSSFNPPHLGHCLIIQEVKEYAEMDKIILMPCYRNPLHQDKVMASPIDRYNMAKILTNKYIDISDYELKCQKISYSIDTLDAFAKKSPGDQFYWIIGSDLLAEFKNWKDWKKIIYKYGLIVFPRETFLPHLKQKALDALDLKTIPNNIIVLNSPDLVLTNLSSTLIRKRVREGKNIKYLVTEKVEKYIKEKKLYFCHCEEQNK